MTRQEATEFYRKHSKALYNASLRIVRDPDEAEEIMQDTLMKYIDRGVRSSTDAQAASWLRTTCIRMSIDALRRRKRGKGLLEGLVFEEAVEEEEDLPETMDVMQIRTAMERLPHPYSLILDLILIEGMDYTHISRLTGQKEATLRSWFSRGRAKLIKELKYKTI
jgi:RNA polymerase sigma-70 factor (ECF subfamily)